MLRIQQQRLSDAFVTEDITGLTTGLSSMTAKATVDLEKAAHKVVAPLADQPDVKRLEVKRPRPKRASEMARAA